MYKRVILKLSGEALSGQSCGTDKPVPSTSGSIDPDTAYSLCESIKKCADCGVQIGIVVGGGNFWRGRDCASLPFTRRNKTRADHIGMLATVMNAIAVSEILDDIGCKSRVMTSFPVEQLAELYTVKDAEHHLQEGRVLVFGGGTGNPFFTTDSAAALRACELSANVLLKATMVDGVYDKDPHKFPDAKLYRTLTATEVLERDLRVMDATAAALCRDNGMPILVFNLSPAENIYRAVMKEDIGTLVN